MIWRRLRGALGTMLTWTFGYAAAGAVSGLLYDIWQRVVHPLAPTLPTLVVVGGSMLSSAIVGAFAGAIFAGTLAVAERGRRFIDLSTRRVWRYGAFAGAALPALAVVASTIGGGPVPLFALVSGAALGSSVAVGTLAVARRAADRAIDQPEPDANA